MRLQHWFYKLPRRVRSLFCRPQLEIELDEEMQYHIERQIEHNITKGMTRQEARYAALRAFGNAGVVKESTRDLWRGTFERMIHDFRHALCMIRRAPGFTALAVLTLVIGIGTTTAMFSVLNGVLLKPLGYREPGDLVAVSAVSAQVPAAPLSAYYFAQWRAQSRTIDGVAAVGFGNFRTFTGGGESERVSVVRASANLFPLLGVQPQRGRNFLPIEDQQSGAANVVILSDGFWTRRFGRDSNVIGTRIDLNGELYEVVGIMPPDFRFPKDDELHRMIKMPAQIDAWLPLVFTPQETHEYLNANYAGIARLRHGTPRSTSEAELNRIVKESPNMPRAVSDVQIRITPLQTKILGRVQKGLVVLMIAVAVVLLIACVNITNLLLARAANHRREIAIRSALGATRAQLARIPIAESFVVTILGAAGGALAASWLINLVRANTPFGLPRVDEIALDLRTLTFTVGAALVSAIVCGAVPALRFSKADPGDALHEAGRSFTASRSGHRLRSVLVSVESALCVTLTIVAGLLIHSFVRIAGLDQGFRPDNVIAANVVLRYPQPAARTAFFNEVTSRLEALPGIQSVGAVSTLPLTGQLNIMGVTPETSPDWYSGGTQAEYRTATRGYFAAMNIPLLRGNVFTDRADGPKTAVCAALYSGSHSTLEMETCFKFCGCASVPSSAASTSRAN